MLKKSALVVAIGTLCSLSFLSAGIVSAQSACINISHDLQLEARDTTTDGDVSRLQKFLSQQDPLIYPEKKVDGYYGPATRLAVYRWQKANNVKASVLGSVDSVTRSALSNCRRSGLVYRATYSTVRTTNTSVSYSSNGCPIFSRSLSRGVSGSDVQALQSFLVSRNLLSADSVSGYFGPLTERAVQNWQSSAGIVSSGNASTGFGVLGPRTRAALSQNCSTNTTSVASAQETAPRSSVSCTNVKPASCGAGYVPGGTCNLVCVLDNTPPPQWVLDMLQNPSSQTQQTTAQNSNTQTQTQTQQNSSSQTQTTQNTQTQTSGPLATISASGVSGVPFAVLFSGTYNANGACDGAQFDLGYGDESSETFDSTCARSTYSTTHTYSDPGEYNVYLDKVTGTGDQQTFSTQAELLITISPTGGVTVQQISSPSASAAQKNLAAAFTALEYAFSWLTSYLNR
jgi:peptidoglycan hydrolase-like protein with peptidoglycan-binding domain